MAARQIVSVRMDPDLLDAADRRAAEQGISRSEHLSRLAARDALTASASGSQAVEEAGDDG